MNNIIRNCDNNCSDYQNRTFTVTFSNNVNSQHVGTYENCGFGKQIPLPEVSSTEDSRFAGWEENGILYPGGTTINVQSEMNFVAKFIEPWVKVWESTSINKVEDSKIESGRRTKIKADIKSRYMKYGDCDGCYCYALDEEPIEVDEENDEFEISASGNANEQTKIGNARFIVSSGRISVVFDDIAQSVIEDNGEDHDNDRVPAGGSVTFKEVYQIK